MASTPDRWLVLPFWPGLAAIALLGSFTGKRNDNQLREWGHVEGTQHISMPAAAAPHTAQAEPAQLLFVIPAFNEQENLPTLFEDLLQTSRLLGAGSRIFIVDDGSADETPDARSGLRRPAAGRARPARRRTRALARRSARASARRSRCANPDALIVTLEADTTSDLDALPQMLDEVERGADVVLADWRMVGVSAHRRLLSAGGRLGRAAGPRARGDHRLLLLPRLPGLRRSGTRRPATATG